MHVKVSMVTFKFYFENYTCTSMCIGGSSWENNYWFYIRTVPFKNEWVEWKRVRNVPRLVGIWEFNLDHSQSGIGWELVKCVHSGWQYAKKLWKFTIQ